MWQLHYYGTCHTDFSCLESKDIYNETLKECVKRYKETEEGIQTMCKVMDDLRNDGMDAFAKLTKELLDSGRTKDLSRATEDKEYRAKLMKELAIQ